MLGRQRVLTRTLIGMGAVHATLGESSHACELLEQAVQLLTEVARTPQSWLWEGLLGQLYYSLGAAYARLNEQEIALDCLGKAVASGWRDVRWIASDPEFTALRLQSRFQSLQESLRLLPAVEFQPSLSP